MTVGTPRRAFVLHVAKKLGGTIDRARREPGCCGRWGRAAPRASRAAPLF